MSKYIFFTGKQRGDTIIEVLLAMAVLGMVLGTSFGIVNRSLATGRDAQERSEATKLAESQLEKLKTASSDPDNGFFSIGETSVYCVTDTLEAVEFGSGPIQDSVELDSYADECKAGPDGRYRMSIIRSGNVFTVRTRWNSIRGEQLNEAKVTYRTYAYSTREYPVVSTGNTVIVEGLNATITGTVTDQGKTAVTERGFIYNTSPEQHPSAGTTVLEGNGLGEFSTVLSLAPNTVYFVRAFATNDSGTSYGSEVQFTTSANTVPTLGVAGASSISTVSAQISSTVNDGGSTITRQGVIIGPTSTLVLDSSRTINDSPGASAVSTTVGGLLPNTTYFAMTFAVNAIGTSYSAVFSFTTSSISSPIPLNPPTTFNGNTYYLSTQQATWSEAKSISASSGGHLVSISSAAENAFVAGLAAGSGTWLSLNDTSNEGFWVWDSDDASTGAGSYRNWATGEPNNYFNGTVDEDVAVMNWGSSGAWNDWFNDSATRAYFVIEYEGSPMANKAKVNGSNYSACITAAVGFPCVVTGSSVYSRSNFRVDYALTAASSTPGYNTLLLDYSDFTQGAPTPPDSLYNYRVNIYVNGLVQHTNYVLKPSGGVAQIPITASSISSVSIEWTNNEWVPVNTFQYDPDIQINSVTVGTRP